MSSLASFVKVLAKKTTEGSFAHIMSTNSLPARRFPSPRQFHAKQLIVLSGADDQPPPIQKNLHRHSNKPVVAWKVNLHGQVLLESSFSAQCWI